MHEPVAIAGVNEEAGQSVACAIGYAEDVCQGIRQSHVPPADEGGG